MNEENSIKLQVSNLHPQSHKNDQQQEQEDEALLYQWRQMEVQARNGPGELQEPKNEEKK